MPTGDIGQEGFSADIIAQLQQIQQIMAQSNSTDPAASFEMPPLASTDSQGQTAQGQESAPDGKSVSDLKRVRLLCGCDLICGENPPSITACACMIEYLSECLALESLQNLNPCYHQKYTVTTWSRCRTHSHPRVFPV